DLEQAARLRTRREVPDERRHRREPRRMRRPMRQRVVRDLVVAMDERDVRGVDAVQHGVRRSSAERTWRANARAANARCMILRRSRRKAYWTRGPGALNCPSAGRQPASASTRIARTSRPTHAFDAIEKH